MDDKTLLNNVISDKESEKVSGGQFTRAVNQPKFKQCPYCHRMVQGTQVGPKVVYYCSCGTTFT